MQIRVIFAAVAAVAILAGCAAGNDRLRNLNSQQIAEQIVDNPDESSGCRGTAW